MGEATARDEETPVSEDSGERGNPGADAHRRQPRRGRRALVSLEVRQAHAAHALREARHPRDRLSHSADGIKCVAL